MKKAQFVDLIFTAIEAGESEKVIRLYEQYPKYKNSFSSSNSWSPVAYACRYGNIDLVKYFIRNNFNYESSPGFNLLHVCCLSGEVGMLRFLVEEVKMNPNSIPIDNINQSSPIKIACKYQFFGLIEYLYDHGAYVIDNGIYHNVYPTRSIDKDGRKINEIFRNSKGEEIPPSAILKVQDYKDPKIRSFFRWLRYRNFLFTVHAVKRNKAMQKQKSLANVLVEYHDQILGYL